MEKTFGNPALHYFFLHALLHFAKGYQRFIHRREWTGPNVDRAVGVGVDIFVNLKGCKIRIVQPTMNGELELELCDKKYRKAFYVLLKIIAEI